mmetsp:Transcript_6772/g.9189  ORF Transcript_6772/g.9189 Transcript_6772/m.9189 type:complete len:245 (+) Transcript_6772:282-1016(+)
MTDYGDKAFWDARYLCCGSLLFEWYLEYEQLKESLYALVQPRPEQQILIVGCGNSAVGESLYDEGFRKITSIDYSEPCISLMKTRSANTRPELKYFTVDASILPFPDDTYQTVFDKGTLDCVACGTDPAERVHKVLKNVSRVLRTGGIFAYYSYSSPDNRVIFLKKDYYSWELSIHVIKKPSLKDLVDGRMEDFTPREYNPELDKESNAHHFLYIMKKMGPTHEQKEAIEAQMKKNLEDDMTSS